MLNYYNPKVAEKIPVEYRKGIPVVRFTLYDYFVYDPNTGQPLGQFFKP